MTVSLSSISDQPLFQLLNSEAKVFLTERARELRLSVQDCRQVCEIALDFQMWGVASIQDAWPEQKCQTAPTKARKQQLMKLLRSGWEELRNSDNQYPEDSNTTNQHGVKSQRHRKRQPRTRVLPGGFTAYSVL